MLFESFSEENDIVEAVRFRCFGKEERHLKQEMHASEGCYAGLCQDAGQSFVLVKRVPELVVRAL